MPKIVLSMFTLLVLSCGLSMANECQIKEISPTEEANNFTFQTILQKGLVAYTPQPKKALLASDGVTYIYDEDNLIGFMTVRERFQRQETIEKTIQESYFNDCSKPIIKINKANFDLFVIENKMDEKPRATAIIIDKTDDSYFYLLSFVGFSQEQATQMLIRK